MGLFVGYDQVVGDAEDTRRSLRSHSGDDPVAGRVHHTFQYDVAVLDNDANRMIARGWVVDNSKRYCLVRVVNPFLS